MKIQNAGNQLSKVSSNVIFPVLPSKSKLWLKPTDQMDSWLDSLGYYRKHIARDASSLFRCVSENIFLTQVHHLTVRKHCVYFAINNPEIFKLMTNVPIQEYVDRLYNQREWGNRLDMEIMAQIYNIDFYMYKEIKKPVEDVTSNGFSSLIVLSLSYEHHYDSVYSKQHIMNTAICQSVFYEILYKCVFKLEEVDYAVSRMLHDKTARYNSDLSMAFFSTGFQMRLEMRDNCRNVKDLLNCGITPFPYKVAKSLDVNIYRNVEYDTWNEQRKGLRHGLTSWNNRELQVGSRCVINFNENNSLIKRHGYIQQMSPDKGPVLVFVEELGEKLTVPYKALEILPSTNSKQSKENTAFHSETFSSDTDDEDDEKIPKIKEEDRIGIQPPELCNVHYVHSTSTSIPTTCYACITSQNCMAEQINSVKSTQPLPHSKVTEDGSKVSYDTSSNDMTHNNHIASLSIPYHVPVYPVMTQDTSHQQATVVSSGIIPSKQSNPGDFSEGSHMRVMYGHTVDPYYRYGYSNYPCYVVAPNYVFPTNVDHAVHQNNDVPRINYSPTSYPISTVGSEVYYTLPVSNVASKVEVPLYSAQTYYPPYVKKPTRNVSVSNDCVNVESNYRSKDLMCIKDSVPLTPPPPPLASVPPSVYPVAYPPVYYHSYDYHGMCPEMQSYEGIASTYPAPQQYVPLTYSGEMYPTGGQVICPPLLPNPSQ